MKVLIVDDVDYIRKSIQKVLEENQFSCDICENGNKAVEHLQAYDYDLIITDIMMPDMDGFELLDYIRQQEAPKNAVPVLAISGGSKTINPETALDIIEEHADYILQKPFTKQDLTDAISKLIGQEEFSKVAK